jgi:hypothetical protein
MDSEQVGKPRVWKDNARVIYGGKMADLVAQVRNAAQEQPATQPETAQVSVVLTDAQYRVLKAVAANNIPMPMALWTPYLSLLLGRPTLTRDEAEDIITYVNARIAREHSAEPARG